MSDKVINLEERRKDPEENLEPHPDEIRWSQLNLAILRELELQVERLNAGGFRDPDKSFEQYLRDGRDYTPIRLLCIVVDESGRV